VWREPVLMQCHHRAEAVQSLSKQFKGTNQTMLRILSVKDAVNELHEVVDKRGYLMAQVEGKRWKKRWFVLRGFVLYYYNKKEEQDDIAGAEGEVSLENAVVSGHDDAESKPVREEAGELARSLSLGCFTFRSASNSPQGEGR
jgi:hypothetical protein